MSLMPLRRFLGLATFFFATGLGAVRSGAAFLRERDKDILRVGTFARALGVVLFLAMVRQSGCEQSKPVAVNRERVFHPAP